MLCDGTLRVQMYCKSCSPEARLERFPPALRSPTAPLSGATGFLQGFEGPRPFGINTLRHPPHCILRAPQTGLVAAPPAASGAPHPRGVQPGAVHRGRPHRSQLAGAPGLEDPPGLGAQIPYPTHVFPITLPHDLLHLAAVNLAFSAIRCQNEADERITSYGMCRASEQLRMGGCEGFYYARKPLPT